MNNAKEEKGLKPKETIKKDPFVIADAFIRKDWTIIIPAKFRRKHNLNVGDEIAFKYLPLSEEL